MGHTQHSAEDKLNKFNQCLKNEGKSDTDIVLLMRQINPQELFILLFFYTKQQSQSKAQAVQSLVHKLYP